MQEYAAVVWALTRYGEDYKNDDARNLAISYAAEMYSTDNPYIYLKLEDTIKEYVNLIIVPILLFFDEHRPR